MAISVQWSLQMTGMVSCRFHVDKMSSAHVYLRLHKGQNIDDIPEGVLEDCAQLVKANSIQGKYQINLFLFLFAIFIQCAMFI